MARAFFIVDVGIQIGFAGLPHEVLQQQREQAEGRLLSQRWISATHQTEPCQLQLTHRNNNGKTDEGKHQHGKRMTATTLHSLMYIADEEPPCEA